MRKFKAQYEEPKNRVESGYSIRDRWKLEDVQLQLEAAREFYTKETGVSGWARKIRRKAVDNTQPVMQTMRVVPNLDYVSPVLNTVQFLLEVTP